MRTYEEQISAVEKRIAAHTAKKRKAMKIGFSCMSVLLVITASVTAVMVSNRNIMNKSDAGGEKLAVMESVMDSAANIEETGDVTEFETITATKFYGNITESERSKDDIFEILGEENEKISAYEDTNYIYFFYPDGRLHRMQNIAEIHHTVKLVTDDEGIKEYSEKHLKRYIPYFDAKNYKVTVNHSPDAFPAWHLSYTIAENGIIIDEINIRFLDNGELYYLSHQTCTESSKVTAKEAVDIALNEINDKFGVDISDTKEYEISAFVAPSNEGDYYNISVSGIPYKNGDFTFERTFFVNIDASNKNVIDVYEGD
ncbi:MAG: hypothetical protein UHZ05_07710 [Acutalibacteraceae bacterium]|nr:hypothetical protein [Acutalibacteraceae bacterium]